jgi:SAM-dependent methyltransferase
MSAMSQPVALVQKILRRLRYELFDAPRGRGRGWSGEIWDEKFREGSWNHLFSADELGHYMVVLGYVIQFGPPSPSLLDVGCGSGRLLKLLQLAHFGSYMGVDISAIAVDQAKALAIPDTCFAVGRFEDWHSTDQFDFVIFNESIAYADKPTKVLELFERNLKENGKFIISMHHYGNHRAIWRTIRREHSVLAVDEICNRRGQKWTTATIERNRR